jgi:hypothetical protein
MSDIEQMFSVLMSVEISPQSIHASSVTKGCEAMGNVQGNFQPCKKETGLEEDLADKRK